MPELLLSAILLGGFAVACKAVERSIMAVIDFAERRDKLGKKTT